jgi:hypothetical protein
LHVLLAALLLVLPEIRDLSLQPYDDLISSNDLLRSQLAEHASTTLTYQIVAQNAEDVQTVENAPAVSMGPYLIQSGQTSLLLTLSIYSLRGETSEQIRLLYMNAPAIQIWKEMGNMPKIIGARTRPPRAALLTLGVPFSS